MPTHSEHEIRLSVETVYRSESRRVFATLVRLLRDFDLAEEAMHEAFALAVIYLVYNEGYSASSGNLLTRSDLSQEAIRLGRLLVELLPDPEAIGLLALMMLQESRDAYDGRSSLELNHVVFSRESIFHVTIHGNSSASPSIQGTCRTPVPSVS